MPELNQMDEFSFNFSDVVGNSLNTSTTDSKDKLDLRGRELRDYINGLIAVLKSIDCANYLQAKDFDGITKRTIQYMLEQLDSQKLDVDGDFKGTLNGYPIVAADPGQSSIVSAHTSQLADIVTVNIKNYGAHSLSETGYTTFDSTSAIQAAVNYVNSIGGGKVLIPKGYFLISSSIIVYPHVTIEGIGDKSNIRSYNNIDFFVTPAVSGTTYESISIKNVTLESLATTYSHYQIHFVNPVYAYIHNVQFICNGATTSDTGGIFIENVGTTGGFMTHIDKCWLREASIVLNQTDSKITNSWIWSDSRSFAISIGAANITIENTDIVPSYINGGIYIYNGTGASIYGTKVIGCFFDGSYSNINTGYGVIGVKADGLIVKGCYFWNSKKGGIYLEDTLHSTVQGNFFLNNNREDNFYSDIVIVGKTLATNSNIITDNNFRTDAARTNKGYAIEEKNQGYNPSDNIFDNIVVYGNYVTPSIKRLAYSYLGAILGSTCVTRATGGSVLAYNTTSIVVNHGLSITPTAQEIVVTLGSSLGSAHYFYVNNITATSFTINVDVQPNPNNVQFYWRAEIKR